MNILEDFQYSFERQLQQAFNSGKRWSTTSTGRYWLSGSLMVSQSQLLVSMNEFLFKMFKLMLLKIVHETFSSEGGSLNGLQSVFMASLKYVKAAS